jgi:hypothetical protein
MRQSIFLKSFIIIVAGMAVVGGGVSANLLYGFGQIILQNLLPALRHAA